MRYRVTIQDGNNLWARPCDATFVVVSKESTDGGWDWEFHTAGDVPFPVFLNASRNMLLFMHNNISPDSPKASELAKNLRDALFYIEETRRVIEK